MGLEGRWVIEGRRVSEKEYRNRVAAGERGFVIPKLVGGGCGLSKEKGGNAGSVVAPQEEEDEQRPMDTKEIVVSGNGQASVQSSAVVNEQKPAAAVPQAKGESISMDTGNAKTQSAQGKDVKTWLDLVVQDMVDKAIHEFHKIQAK